MRDKLALSLLVELLRHARRPAACRHAGLLVVLPPVLALVPPRVLPALLVRLLPALVCVLLPHRAGMPLPLLVGLVVIRRHLRPGMVTMPRRQSRQHLSRIAACGSRGCDARGGDFGCVPPDPSI